MKVFSIGDMVNGWFVGNFTPSVLQTENFEVGVHLYEKGYEAPDKGHYHKIATEINYIIKGKVLIKGNVLTKGDIFIYEPYDKSYVDFLEDTELVIVKAPSVPGDKYTL